jgi:CheY-like chemotaxis protein
MVKIRMGTNVVWSLKSVIQVSESHRQKILNLFQPFRQGSHHPNGLKFTASGDSSHLSICKQLAILMKGSIEVESNPKFSSLSDTFPAISTSESSTNTPQFSIFRGSSAPPRTDAASSLTFTTVFTCILYFASATGGNAVKYIARQEKRRQTLDSIDRFMECPDYKLRRHAMSLLIVDDNAVNVKVLKRLLEKHGFHTIEVATNGQEAVDAVSRNKLASLNYYEIILMDIEVSRLVDGVEHHGLFASCLTIYQLQQPLCCCIHMCRCL